MSQQWSAVKQTEEHLGKMIDWYLSHRARNCFYCGLLLFGKAGQAASNHRTRDHVVPRSKGGRKMVPACHPCNQAKAGMSLNEFRELRYSGTPILFYGEAEFRRRKSAAGRGQSGD